MTPKIFAVLFACVLIASSATAQEQRQQPTTVGPSALDTHAARLEHDAVEDLKAGSPASGWFVDLDIVFPTDRAEYEAVGKHILLVFALFSDDQAELPLAHAYNDNVPLRCLKSVPRDVPPASAMVKAFGRFRTDTLCLLPIALKRRSDRITIDFAKREGLEVSSRHLKEPDFVQADNDTHSPPMPDPAALQAFIDREYPGFGFRVAR